MTVYFSDRIFSNEIISFLQKNYPRGKRDSNSLSISRSSNIDYNLLLKYFICALAKEHNTYTAAITLPIDLYGKIPGWYIKKEKEVFVDPNTGPHGENIYNESVFVVKFNFFVNEKNIHKIPDTKEVLTDDALIAELVEIRHALINGNFESIEVLREFYQQGEITSNPKSLTAKYLSKIIDFPH
jgi:hypothetical protein